MLALSYFPLRLPPSQDITLLSLKAPFLYFICSIILFIAAVSMCVFADSNLYLYFIFSDDAMYTFGMG